MRQSRMVSQAPPAVEPKITARNSVPATSATVTMRRIARGSTSSMKDSSTPTGAKRRAIQMFAPITAALSTRPMAKSDTFQNTIVRKIDP